MLVTFSIKEISACLDGNINALGNILLRIAAVKPGLKLVILNTRQATSLQNGVNKQIAESSLTRKNLVGALLLAFVEILNSRDFDVRDGALFDLLGAYEAWQDDWKPEAEIDCQQIEPFISYPARLEYAVQIIKDRSIRDNKGNPSEIINAFHIIRFNLSRGTAIKLIDLIISSAYMIQTALNLASFNQECLDLYLDIEDVLAEDPAHTKSLAFLYRNIAGVCPAEAISEWREKAAIQYIKREDRFRAAIEYEKAGDAAISFAEKKRLYRLALSNFSSGPNTDSPCACVCEKIAKLNDLGGQDKAKYWFKAAQFYCKAKKIGQAAFAYEETAKLVGDEKDIVYFWLKAAALHHKECGHRSQEAETLKQAAKASRSNVLTSIKLYSKAGEIYYFVIKDFREASFCFDIAAKLGARLGDDGGVDRFYHLIMGAQSFAQFPGNKSCVMGMLNKARNLKCVSQESYNQLDKLINLIGQGKIFTFTFFN